MENIFEGAKFGDKFLCRDGGLAILLEENDEGYVMMYEEICTATVSSLGCIDNCDESDYDIVSRYQEPIDEDKLEEFAETYANKMHIDYGYYNDWSPLKEGFKSGYHKAKEG